MLVVWNGNGLYVLIVLAGVLVAYVTGAYFVIRPDNIAHLPDWLFGAGFVTAGALCFWIGRRLHSPPGTLRPMTERLLMYEPGQRHDLYHIKFEYWGLLYVGLGVWWLLT